MNKPLIFFDLDGTILDIRNRYYNLYSDSLVLFGGTPIPMKQYWNLKQSKTKEFEIIRISGNENIFPAYEQNRLGKIESLEYLIQDEVWSGLEKYLQILNLYFDLSIVTLRHSPDLLQWQIEHLGLEKFFYHVISPPSGNVDSFGYEVKVKLVQEVYGDEKLQGWFIGDTEVDILAGKALGLRTCAVGFGLRNFELFQSLQPDVFAETPDDMMEFLSSLYTGQDLK